MKICILNGNELSNESEENFINFLENEDLVHYLLFAFHQNTASFVNSLTKKLETNGDGNIWFRNIEWMDYFWYFVSTPLHKTESAKKIATERNLIVLPYIPTIIIENEKLLFPIEDRTNIFTLIDKKPD